LKAGVGWEIPLRDAIAQLLTEQAFRGFEPGGETFDCGGKLGLLLANMEHGLAEESIGPAFPAALIEQISREHAAARRPQASVPGTYRSLGRSAL
jgi:UTP--glucose-1-phosphate uridylyltransferase